MTLSRPEDIWVFVIFILLTVFFTLLSICAMRRTGRSCKWQVFWVSFFMMFWIVPNCYQNYTKKQIGFLTATTRDMYGIACLFTHSMNSWPVFYIQVLPQNSQEWTTVSEDLFFKMKIFGYRTKFYRLAGTLQRTKERSVELIELTDWIRRRYARLNPGEPPLAGVRLVRVMFPVGSAIPKKRFTYPALSDIPIKMRQVLYERLYTGKAIVPPRPTVLNNAPQDDYEKILHYVQKQEAA